MKPKPIAFKRSRPKCWTTGNNTLHGQLGYGETNVYSIVLVSRRCRLPRTGCLCGKTDLAIKELETSFSFNPHMRPSNYMQLGIAYYLKGRYDDAMDTLEQGLSWYPDDVFIHIPLAAAYAQAGRPKDAARVAAKVRKLRPFFEVDNYGTAFIKPTDRTRIVDGLRKAGL